MSLREGYVKKYSMEEYVLKSDKLFKQNTEDIEHLKHTLKAINDGISVEIH